MNKLLLPLLCATLLSAALAAPGGREVQMHSKKLDFDDKQKKLRLIGDVRITTAGYVMTAPYAEWFATRKVAEFQGGVRLSGQGTVATGKRMTVNYPESRATLRGDVHLVTDQGDAQTTLTGDQLDYAWTQGTGTARGHVKVTQAGRNAYADRAVYDRDRQVVTLEGNVRVERGDGDWIASQRARMNLASRTVEADGGVTARTIINTKETTGSPTPVPLQATPTPMEPPFPMTVPTAAPAPKLPGVDE